MRQRSAGRTVLVGIDGFSPIHMDRYLSKGQLPALGELVRQGSRVRLVSTLPASTPVAWASVSTGCHPNITGIEGFLVHRPGQPFDRRLSGCYAHRCQAEPIWQAATTSGLRAIVVKFPLSYPSDSATLRVDGAAGWGGLKCLHEAVSSGVVTTDGVDAGVRCDAPGWAGSPPSGLGGSFNFARVRLESLWGKDPVILHLAIARGASGPQVVIAREANWVDAMAVAGPGEWTNPMTVPAAGRRGPVVCCFRVKVLACTDDPVSLRLYHTPLHERSGHSSPAALWEKHLDAIGPIEEQTEPSLALSGAIDLETLTELFRLNQQWLIRAAVRLLEHESPDLFMIQVHFVDWAHHVLHGGIDPWHPDFDPAQHDRYDALLLETYRMADELVGVVRRAAGPEANVIAMGDHGQDLHHTTVHLNEWLAEEGWLRWAGDADEVDWPRTAAYSAGNYVYVNTEGRDPSGIVPAHRAPDVAREIAGRLSALRDPARPGRPIRVAGPKTQFASLGADGAGVGDVVFCTSSGYQARNNRGPLFEVTRFLHDFTSGHDHFSPLDERIHTRLYAAGPLIRRGYDAPGTHHLIDVAPTIAEILNIPPPALSQGRALDVLGAGSRERGFSTTGPR